MLTAADNRNTSGNKISEFIFIGLGDLKSKPNVVLEDLRRAMGSLVLKLKKHGIKSAVLRLPENPDSVYGVDRAELLKQAVIIANMADYDFSLSQKKLSKKRWDGTLLIETHEHDKKITDQALCTGNIIGTAVNNAREWSDTPANILTPTKLSQEAQTIANDHDLSCTIFGRDKAQELGMGAFLAVDAGSEQPGKFVILDYQPKVKPKATIVLVGKGVIFDSGGLSLKSYAGMAGMKYDMSGSATVIATMKIIAQLKPNIRVIGLTPLVENMPSGSATRQDDVITAMNGKTIEVKSTDAEGRLILADALCYAEKFYQPDIMIDIATLTGACQHALGFFNAGLMTQDDQLREVLFELGRATGDRVWPLPLGNDYKNANKSNIADVSNAGNPVYRAGSITAGSFLSEFVAKTRWAHIDAASAHDVPDINYLGQGKGSAGMGVRLLTEFVMGYENNLGK